MTAATITISNEEEAWGLLKNAIRGNVPAGVAEIRFENWPVLDLKLRGEQFQSSLTTKVMEGFIDLQTEIYRAYAKFHYNRTTAGALTKEDKQALEIIVRVSPGSAEYKAMLQQALETVAKGIVGKMDAKHWVIVLVSAGLMWSGQTCWNSYLETERQKKEVEVQAFANEQETKRMEILAAAFSREPELNHVYAGAKQMYNTMLRGAAAAESVEIFGRNIQQEAVQELVRSERAVSEETSITGVCRILKVDTSKTEGFGIAIQFEDGTNVNASLEDKWIFRKEKHLALLQKAVWQKEPILLRVKGRDLRGKITQAVIVDVEELDERKR